MPRRALQLCPNDSAPFADICAGHTAALAQLGFEVRTLFFEARGAGIGEFVPVAEVPEALGETGIELLVTHRYRAYRAGVCLARRGVVARHVAIAHEFGMFGRYRRRLRRRLADRGSRFAGVSPAVADDLAVTGAADPALLPNPIDADALRTRLLPRSEARRALGLPPDALAIGVLGRLHPKKAPRRALAAFRRFAPTERAARLVFVGDGPLRSQLERDAGSQVVFAGFRAEARRLLSAFDVLLSCSTEHEAFGFAILEAMAAGVPVISTDQPGPRFVLGDCGQYFETDDELLEALATVRANAPAATRERMVHRVETAFSASALADRYKELLE